MSIVGKEDRENIDRINKFLMDTNTSFRSGTNVDYLLVSSSITAIMILDDVSSYPVLFDVLCTSYPEIITLEAHGAMDLINGNLFQFLSGVIRENQPNEKFAALRAGVNSQRLSISERGQLACLALEQVLLTDDDDADIEAMRFAAVQELTSLRWTNANTFAILHYQRMREKYFQDIIPKNRLVEAIRFLGAVGNSEAALVLGLQLGLINARTERTGIFDAEITHAIVQALGYIGVNAAFDHLLHVNNLPYPEYIKIAAREAADRLRW
jgi:hypothetical protein